MNDIRVAAVQFENQDNDKAYNLGRIRDLTRSSVERGAQIVSFHECCIPAYSWMQGNDPTPLEQAAEKVPDGHSVQELIKIAQEFKVIVMAGLIERENDKFYNTYVTVGPDGYITKFRKLHPFVNTNLTLLNF